MTKYAFFQRLPFDCVHYSPRAMRLKVCFVVVLKACRGDQVDSGVQMASTATDSVTATYTIPRQADILLAYSTVPGKSVHLNVAC